MASRPLTTPRLGWTQAIPRVTIPRAARKYVLYAVLGGLLLSGGWMWFRGSAFVAVNDVSIAGVKGPEAHAIRMALQGAATEMTTLQVRPGQLRTAVAQYPIVKSVTATADFPHKLRIDVVEHTPVAAVVVGGRNVPVAEDGTILRGAYISSLTPLTAKTPPVGTRVTDPFLLAAVHVLAAATPAQRRSVEKVFMGPRGLTIRLKNGPSAAFGSGHRALAKWIALATMLSAQSVAAAKLIDVSVPERPAIPGAAPLATATTDATGTATAADPAATAPADATAATSTPVTPQVVQQTPVVAPTQAGTNTPPPAQAVEAP